MTDPSLHPYEIRDFVELDTQVWTPREVVRVKTTKPNCCLPIADAIPNTWILRANNSFTIRPHDSFFHPLDLEFELPQGMVGVITPHPLNHGEPLIVAPCNIFQHYPNGGVTLQLTNISEDPIWVTEGHFLALMYFQRCMAVQMVNVTPRRPEPTQAAQCLSAITTRNGPNDSPPAARRPNLQNMSRPPPPFTRGTDGKSPVA